MTAALLPLLRAARGAGVRISAAEAIDGMRAAEAVGWEDRRALRDALGLALAKTEDEKRLFEDCFDLYFSRAAFEPPAAEGEAEPPSPSPDAPPLARLLDDPSTLAQQVEAAAQAVGLSDIVLFTQTGLYTRRILEQMGLDGLDASIAALRTADGAEAARLDAARSALFGQVRLHVEQQLALFGAGARREAEERMLREARLSSLDRRDFARMRALVRALAKRLAARYGRQRRRARRGQIDARRTIRRSMGFDAIPFHPVWRRRRIERSRVMVLCDVSGSVANVSRFMLLFLCALHDVLDGMRAFAFSAELSEVSHILEREPTEAAIARVLEEAGFGSTNYGRALADFATLALDAIDRRTTVIVLGDARGNGNDPRLDLWRAISARARQVIWLNPEHRSAWGGGDSDMLRYQPFCRHVATCNTVAGLDRTLSALLADRAG